MLLEIFHKVVDLGGVKLLALEVVFEDLVFLFHLVEFGDKFEYFVFGGAVFLNQGCDVSPQIFEQVVFVIPFFPENLVVPVKQVILIISFLKRKPN